MAEQKAQNVDLIALDNALTELARLDPQQSQIVKMRFFGGLSIEDTAEVMGVSRTTVKRDCATARAWLREMSRKEGAHDSGRLPARQVYSGFRAATGGPLLWSRGPCIARRPAVW